MRMRRVKKRYFRFGGSIFLGESMDTIIVIYSTDMRMGDGLMMSKVRIE